MTKREAMDLRDLVTRTLTVRADTLNVEQRSVEAVLATENRATVFDFNRFDFIEEILIARGLESAGQVVLLEAHRRYELADILGSVRDIRVEGKQVVGRLVFAEGDDRADAAFNKVRQGHITDVSVGYRVIEAVDIPPGTSQSVNGKRYSAGAITLRISTKWRVREGSLVPIGADEAAKIRATTREFQVMNEKLRAYLESLGLRSDVNDEGAWAFCQQLSGEQKEKAESLRTAAAKPGEPGDPATGDGNASRGDNPTEPESVPAPVEIPARTGAGPDRVLPLDADAIRAAERQRMQAIRALAGDDVPVELVARAESEGWSPDIASRHFLEHVRAARAPALAVERTAPDELRGLELDAIAAGLMQRASLPVYGPSLGDEAPEHMKKRQGRVAEMSDRFRGMSLVDVCRAALRLAHVNVPDGTDALIKRASSTGELSHIFDAVVNAQLLASYTEAPDTTRGWVREADVPDFKTNERWRLGKSSNLDKLARGDEAGHTKIGDNSESYAIARYAKQFVIDEQDIIDDSMNALMSVPAEMGAAAARLRPDLVYSILLANANMEDGTALFHANHSNLGTGGGSALLVAGLQAGIIAMAKQTEDGVNLNVSPAVLIVPQDLLFTAQILLASAWREAGTTLGVKNPLLDLNLQTVADNRIGAAGVTDPASGTAYTGSATNWFLAAAGNVAPTVEVGYRRGTGRRPSLESFALTGGRWGIGWKINFDIGAKSLDFRGLYKADGA